MPDSLTAASGTRDPIGSCTPTVARNTAPDREARIRAALDQLRPAAEGALRKTAEALVDRPDTELFRAVASDRRDAAHDLATAAQRVAADGRTKGATPGPAPSAPTADPRPASTPPGRAASRP